MEEKDTERVYKQLSQKEHVKLRSSMYIGSTKKQTIEMYVLNPDKTRFISENIIFTPGMLKIFDEILSNAVDNFIKFPKKVTYINVKFSIKNGAIEVENNGPGISLVKVDTLNSGKLYKPCAIFSELLGGDNFNEDEERIGAGCNGLGAKLTNIFSKTFKIETSDGKKLYKQTFRDRLNIIEEPEITPTKLESYTKVRFLPSYADLGYKEYNADIGMHLLKLIEARVYQTAAFVGCSVSFNDSVINIADFKQFSQMFLDNPEEIYSTTLIHPTNKQLNWDLCIGVSNAKFKQLSIMNSLYTYGGGSHIKHIQNEIVENLRKHVEKELNKTKNKFNQNFILNNLFIFVKGSIVNPEFNSQSKEKITVPIERFKDYKFKTKEWKPIWEFLEPHVLESVLGKIKDKKQNRVIRGKVVLEKGEDAKFAGDKKRAPECTLVICEGDSALGMVTRGINHKKTELDKDYYGTFSIQGVPPNCRKMSKEIVNKKDGVVHRIRNEKLKNNKRFTELVKILGLDYEKSYDTATDEGRAEFKTLRYGRVVVAVDQDEDGKGQIFGLLINFFMYFWPRLADWGYVKRFNTPIIRAYPNDTKKVVQEFCTLYTFHKWVEEKFNGDDERASRSHKIKYYKGLASHDVGEIKPMFNKFEAKLYTYEFDNEAETSFETYYGKETDARKKALASPVSPDDEVKEELLISITKLMRTDVKEFQRDNILRKLPHMMDGMVPSRRKAFYAARDIFKTSAAKEIKVCNFTGSVISKTNYHHGDASLAETIIKMAQCFVGARNMPLLIGVGEFGSRLMGGKDHGSPRYVYVKLNQKLTNALYPRCDDFLLPYQFDEGDRCEPVYYMPILPTSILESMCIPATGWKAEIWARDYSIVIKNVRSMINGETNKCKKLRIWLRGNNSDIRYGSDNNTYIVGRYTYDSKSNVLTITELPPGVYNKDYIKSIAFVGDNALKPDFKDVYDHSNYDEETNVDEIDIRFELNPGVMDKWLSRADHEGAICDVVERSMGLCVKINTHLNMIKTDGSVKEYKLYSTVVNEWFEERKRLYEDRITRLIILTNLMIKYLQNIIRFTTERDSYGITNKTPEKKFNEILTKHKYDTFNKTLLFSPKYTAINELEQLIINNLAKDTSYEYIITLTYRQLLEEACQKRQEDLEKEEQNLRDLLDDSLTGGSSFKGQKTWLRELDEVEKIIKHGITKGWSYTKNKPKFN
jgi:DNA topoisomerase-2